MNETTNNPTKAAWLRWLAAIVALIGLGDAIYLTVHHYTAVPVPCSIVEGCEQVLTSPYATYHDIPLAVFGAAAYLLAFVLAVLSALGKRLAWPVFGIQVTFMFIFTLWLLYLQAYVIGAFCQFCLLSALVTTSLFIIFILSLFLRTRRAAAAV
jgi:uncharacterized membrane protein